MSTKMGPYTLADGLMDRMALSDRFKLLGEIMSLCLYSQLHSQFLFDDLRRNFMPAIQCNQFRIYRDAKQLPVGYVSWALLSQGVAEGFESLTRGIHPKDWQSGDQLWFVDFIAPFGHAKSMIKDLKANFFESFDHAHSLKFNPKGEFQKTCLWRRR